MTTTKTATTTIDKRHWQGDQSWCFRHVKAIGGLRLRVEIKRDAYDVQSRAFVDRWDGAQWQRVHDLPMSQCACASISYVDKTIKIDAFAADDERLTTIALAITGGA